MPFGRVQGCRRCSTCSIHYPSHSDFFHCHVCGEPTSFFNNVEPDTEWEEAVRYAKMTSQPKISADAHAHRFEQYLLMGFNEHQAQALANATYGTLGMPLYWGKVKQVLDAGVDHLLAFDMFA